MACWRMGKIACLGILSILTLSACKKAPSIVDVQYALEESMFASSRVTAAFTGHPMDEQVQVESVDNCKSNQNGSGYICDVEYSVSSRSGGWPTESFVESIEFREGNDDWEIID